MNITQQQLAELFKESVNFKAVRIGKVEQGLYINVRVGAGSVRAQALGNLKAGDAIVFQTDQGNWYLIGNNTPVVVSNNNRKQILYQITRHNSEIILPVITLLFHDQNLFQQPLKPEFKLKEFWLTGNDTIVKQIIAKPGDPEIGFDDERFTYSQASDAYVHNYGEGKYLFVSTRSSILYTHPDANFYSDKPEFLIKDAKGETRLITPDTNNMFGYLGNGIYQSFIENGIGKSFDAIPSGLTPFLNYDRMFVQNRINGNIFIPNSPTQYTDGFGTNRQVFSFVSEETSQTVFTFQPINRINANILPDTTNYTIYDGQLITLSGSLNINLSGIYDFNLYVNNLNAIFSPIGQPIYVNDYNLLVSSEFKKDTLPFSTNGGFREYYTQIVDPPLMGWRDRTISHSTWLPDGNKTFTFSSSASKITISALFQTYEYTYNEVMTGELMLMSWKEKYIVHQFSNVNKVTKYDTSVSTSQFNVFDITEITEPGIQSLILKQYGSDNDLLLNNWDKFFVLNKRYRSLTSESNINIALNTTGFRIRYDRSIEYHRTFNPSLNLNSYINEKIITSETIDGKNYIIRGYISNIENQLSSVWVSIIIETITPVPTPTVNATWRIRFLQPFYLSIVLDNGCFWNYYLSFRSDNSLIEFQNSYPRFDYRGNIFSSISPYFGNTVDDLICDQTVKFVHTNPVTVPFCHPYRVKRYFPPANLLLLDNLVNNSIFRVDEYTLVNSYIDIYDYDDLITKQIPISEWKISANGNIKYDNTFLVDYEQDFPHHNKITNRIDDNSYQFNSSYHP